MVVLEEASNFVPTVAAIQTETMLSRHVVNHNVLSSVLKRTQSCHWPINDTGRLFDVMKVKAGSQVGTV